MLLLLRAGSQLCPIKVLGCDWLVFWRFCGRSGRAWEGSVVTWLPSRGPNDHVIAPSAESHVAQPGLTSDYLCSGHCRLAPKACWVLRDSRCVAGSAQRGPRCSSSPTAASYAAARYSGLGCMMQGWDGYRTEDTPVWGAGMGLV